LCDPTLRQKKGEGWGTRRGKGEGHLTRINDILANLMEAERRIGSGR
jgi:hypothetical protein